MSSIVFVLYMQSSFTHSYMYDAHPLDGLPLEDDPRHIILADCSGMCTLILDSLSAQDSGQYVCFAHSFMGSAGTLAKVVVQGKIMDALRQFVFCPTSSSASSSSNQFPVIAAISQLFL